jgi:hypothetical protein
MGISPLSAGDGRPWPNQAFATDSSFFSLAGVANGSIAMHLADVNSDEALYVCTGTWNITSVGSAGPPLVYAMATFTPSATDLLSTNPLGKAGLYEAYPVVTLSTGPVSMDAQLLSVISEP